MLHTVQTYWQVPGYGDRLITYVLAPSGNIAWATETRWSNFRHHSTIHRAIGHTVSTLDNGPMVRPSSLRLRGDTVEWVDGDTQRTASLP